MKMILSLILLSSIACQFALAEETPNSKNDRKPASSLPEANVEVFRVKKSGSDNAEKWVDSNLGIVCYTFREAAGNGTAGGISCLKFR